MFIVGYDSGDGSCDCFHCEWQDNRYVYDYDEGADGHEIGDDYVYGRRCKQDCDAKRDEVVGMSFRVSGLEPH